MARNPELEALIAKAPDDPQNYLVYADWLIQQGDPLGELISVETKNEGNASPELEARAKALHDEHDATWLGELAEQEGVTLTWKRGFIHTAILGDDESAEIEHADLYRKLRAAPAAVMLRELTFAAFQDDDGEPTWDGGVEAMMEYGVPVSLQRLSFDRGSFWDISSTSLNTLEAVYERVPNLAALDIRLGHMNLGTIALPNLREFSVYTGGFGKENMQSVLAATWPKLEKLVLRFGNQEDYGGTCTAEDVLPLLTAKLPNVRHLALANSKFIDDMIPQLAASPLLKQLTSLDLSLGMMTDVGAQAIVTHADAFKHLKELDLHRNYISGDVAAAVSKVCASVNVERQEPAEDDYRYCQIGE